MKSEEHPKSSNIEGKKSIKDWVTKSIRSSDTIPVEEVQSNNDRYKEQQQVEKVSNEKGQYGDDKEAKSTENNMNRCNNTQKKMKKP